MTGQVRSFDGARIAYDVTGKGSTCLLLVHGLGGDKHQWGAQIEHFARQMAVVAVDLAGHGDSDYSRHTWSMGSFARDVAAVANALGLHRIVLVGHSMGGPVILEAEGLLSPRVEALIAVDSFVYPLRADLTYQIDTVFRSLFAADADPGLVNRTLTAVLRTPPEVLLSSFEALWKWDVEAALQRARLPLDCVFSGYLNKEKDFVSRHVARFASVAYLDCGHFIMLESPHELNKYLSDKIAERMGPL